MIARFGKLAYNFGAFCGYIRGKFLLGYTGYINDGEALKKVENRSYRWKDE